VGHGREAVTVRQIFLVVILVAAAFAGGAFVNGPALQWAQNQVCRSFGWHEGDIASIDLKVDSGLDQTPNRTPTSTPDANQLEQPSAPVPSLVANRDEVSVQPSAKQSGRILHEPQSKSATESSPQTALGSPQVASRLKSPVKPPAILDTNIKPAHGPAVTVVPSDLPVNAGAAHAIFNALSDLTPLDKPLDASLPAAASTSKGVNEQHDDWEIIMRKMQTLGVSRFTVEGETGGRVIFSCLIPLAGRQAVTQRFEAEGTDAIQAAHATFRRISLWRSAQDVGHHDGSGRE
jgi:hypothetical protein